MQTRLSQSLQHAQIERQPVCTLGAHFLPLCCMEEKFGDILFITLTVAFFHVELTPRGGGGIGRRRGLKILRWRHLVGSSPTRPTEFIYVGTADRPNIFISRIQPMTNIPLHT